MTVGLTPRFDYDSINHGESSSGVGVSDPSVQIQYCLTQFRPDTGIPVISVDLEENLPVGRYDRLERPTDGFGSGAYVTTFSTFLQSQFWMPNGRITRVRLDLSYGVSSRVPVSGQSVYGTAPGFRGHARPGNSKSADLAFEYSATQNWVLAIDFWLQGNDNAKLVGSYPRSAESTRAPFSSISGPVRELTVASALECNSSSRAGIIFGVQVVAEGRNATATVRPIVAFSYFL